MGVRRGDRHSARHVDAGAPRSAAHPLGHRGARERDAGAADVGLALSRAPDAPLTFGVGAFAGVCSGAAQVGGPAVIAYWLGGPAAPPIMRANIILYFSISTAIAMVAYFVGGVLTLAVAKLALVVGPAYGLGLAIGARLFGIADEAIFRRICYALIADRRAW